MFKKILRHLAFWLSSIVLVLVVLGIIFYLNGPNEQQPAWGLNLATGQARYLGFEPAELTQKILTDLSPSYIRLTTYWEEIEANHGQFDFSTIDSILDLTDSSSTKVLLVVGHKQPRWPECHHPKWWAELAPEEQRKAEEDFVTTTIDHFKDRASIWAWQLENEPFFDFGLNCPVSSRAEYKDLVELVKNLDNRPIVVTDSGEKSAWLPAAWSGADIFGSTMYRQVYHGEQKRYITYPLPAWTYRLKAGMIKLLSPINETLGVELQAEPWFNADPYDIPLNEQYQYMNPQILADNIDYAKKSGFAQHYFWGVEWWYWLYNHHHDPAMINFAKQFFNNK